MSRSGEGQIVWLVETIDWPESTEFIGVFDSVSVALMYLRQKYADPYKVEWGELQTPKSDEDSYRVEAHFEEVEGFSTEHDVTFSIRPEEVQT